MTDEPRSEETQVEESGGGDDPVAALEDRLLRLAADFDNYKKRAARERDEYVAHANERLVKELLPVLDDLERALEAVAQHEEAALEDGVRLVHRSLASLLERHGVTEIATDGRFDPHVHEALLSQPSEEDEGSVIDVLQKGYRLGDRVVRPARVVIAAAPPHPPAAKPPVRESGPVEGAPGEPGGSPARDE